MSSEPIVAALDSSAQRRHLVDVGVLSDYWALTKPEVNFLIVITTFAGFYLGAAEHDFPIFRMLHAVLGTLLVASGAGTLNQYIERRFDSQMRRTSRRPLASGRLKPQPVLWFGIALSVAGALYLALAVNALASLLAMFTLVSYLFCYTPLKRRTPLCTVVGAIPGAMPPLIGWAGASGTLSFEAWVLFAVIFLWQFPHFMAIAWMYREDYDRAGYLVLPRGTTRVPFAMLQTLLPLALLVPVSLLGGGGVGALLLSVGYLYYGIQFARSRTLPSARRLLAASILYLPLFFVVRILSL
jgi:protoheme IX farnesyltransferase